MYYQRALRGERGSAPGSPAAPMSPTTPRQALLREAAVISAIKTISDVDELESDLSVEELAERLRCERLKAASLANLFQAYEAECDTEIKRIRRASERTIQHERRMNGLEPGNVVRATATFALEPELERIQKTVSAAVDSALAAQAEAHEDAQRRLAVGLERLAKCTESVRILLASNAAHSSAPAADTPAGAADEANGTGPPPGTVAAMVAELEAMRVELDAERERSAALELTCAQLIKGATSSYHAPKKGTPRLDTRLEAAHVVNSSRVAKAYGANPYYSDDGPPAHGSPHGAGPPERERAITSPALYEVGGDEAEGAEGAEGAPAAHADPADASTSAEAGAAGAAAEAASTQAAPAAESAEAAQATPEPAAPGPGGGGLHTPMDGDEGQDGLM